MKTIIKLPINGMLLVAFSVMLFWGCSCNTPKPEPDLDPLVGWTFREFDEYVIPAERHHYQLDKSITDDYQGFIAKENIYPRGAITGFFEDGTGQRAVEFEANGNKENSSWHYVIIYDKENRRVKLIKYGYRKYQS